MKRCLKKKCGVFFCFVETWGCGVFIFLVSFNLFGWFVGKHIEEFVSWKVFETLKVGIQKTLVEEPKGC